MPSRPHRVHRPRRAAALAAAALVLVPLLGVSASADTSGAVAPFVDCVTTDPTTGQITAYFGYASSFAATRRYTIRIAPAPRGHW